MIIVSGTKRSGTSMWMHILATAGLPIIGERYPAGSDGLLREANPDGFFESQLVSGINFQTNPHPLTGSYLAPEATRQHAVKVFIAGLVRTDVAFIDRVVATVRDWRTHTVSVRRLDALTQAPADPAMPPALSWWCDNYALIRDIAVRGYPVHVVSYDALLRDPVEQVAEVLDWLDLEGLASAATAAAVISPPSRTADDRPADAQLAPRLAPAHLAVFDELYAVIDAGQPLTHRFIEMLNATDEALRPQVLQAQAKISAATAAQLVPPV